jgi:hypothetical protein
MIKYVVFSCKSENMPVFIVNFKATVPLTSASSTCQREKV